MLGGFRVSAGPHAVEANDWKLRKSASLVKLLALQPENRMHRERVMETLWPSSNAKNAANNLHRALHEARKTLEPSDPSTGHLQLRDEHVVLSPGAELWTDVDAFRDTATVARNTGEIKAYKLAIDSYSGELLPDDRYEEWAEDFRRELAGLHRDLRMELAALYEENGEYRMSVETLEEALVGEPSREEVHASLMRLYALTGRRSKALGQYEHYQRIAEGSHSELEASEIKALHERILAGKLTPPETPHTRPSSSETVNPSNLPVSRTSFIGREREISRIKDLLEKTGLLTLTGVGGSGKTRLALEAARDSLELYPDGVWMVSLAPIADPELVPQTAARIFEVREQPNRSLAEALTATLTEKDLLLVLDNCEHLVEAVARLCETLLDGCPGLRVLATSRELLGVGGEVSWTVPALSLPDPDEEPVVEDLQESESVRLFVDRAVQHDTGFSLTPENVGTVAEICRKLDGIPLAIELAAARVRMLGVEQISERLEDALRLLNDGRRTAVPRQRTLRGALDWSHDLLDDKERYLLRRLAVFAGGFTLESAEQVIADGGIPEDEILRLVSSLLDKSLLVNSERRYRLLETVRQYAREKLRDSGEHETLRGRHARWCVGLVEEAEPELTGPDQVWWMDRLETEHDNLRAALGWALDGEEPELGLRLAGSLWLFWHTRGHGGEGRRWLGLGIKKAGDENARLKARALTGAGSIAMFQRDYEMSESLLAEGAALYREVGDAEGVGMCLSNILFGATLAYRDLEEYRWCMDEVEAIESELTQSRTLANIALGRGFMGLKNGDLKGARSSFEDARGLYDEAGDAQGTSRVLSFLAFEAILRDDHAEAKEKSIESLRISRQQDDKITLMYIFWMLGSVNSREGLHARTARLWGASETVQEQTDMRPAPFATNLTGYEDRLARTRTALGTASLKTEWRRGREMTQEEAIDFALAEETTDNKPLTPGESRVAALIVQGMTNPEISAQLVISERTVHAHVRSILKKLGLSSRSQVAGKLEQIRPGSKPTDPPP
jgi:predicted ATPase/DNA-binding SARP family transcriptional activator/DNA-binding CsgD family transcriptional regulator